MIENPFCVKSAQKLLIVFYFLAMITGIAGFITALIKALV